MKHLFFDLDRTLWDFEYNSKAALAYLYKDFELEKKTKSFESFHKTYQKINNRLWHSYGQGNLSKETLRIKRFEDTLKSFQLDCPRTAQELATAYVEISPKQTKVFPNTHETLEKLLLDNYQLHIITNGFREVQMIKLEKSKLSKYFTQIICSEDVGQSKPAPAVFYHAMKLAGAKPKESLMIGDDFKVDILGAERAGMNAILFDPFNKYNDRAHEWRINTLDRIPEILPYIKTSLLKSIQ